MIRIQNIVKSRLNNRGDTIVEVMLVLVIIGFALGISYDTADRSVQDSRQANQNAQATATLVSQIESLRTMASNPSSDTAQYIYQASDFCVDPTGNVALTSTGAPNASCQYNVFGSPTNLLNVYISYLAPTLSNPGGFTVTGTWPSINGQGDDNVVLTYRLYPL